VPNCFETKTKKLIDLPLFFLSGRTFLKNMNTTNSKRKEFNFAKILLLKAPENLQIMIQIKDIARGQLPMKSIVVLHYTNYEKIGIMIPGLLIIILWIVPSLTQACLLEFLSWC